MRRAVIALANFRARLMLVTLASCVFALTLSCAMLALWQYIDARHELEARNRQLAGVLAATAAAPVVFRDAVAIEETVATAAGLDNASAVAVRDRAGHVLSSRIRSGAHPRPAAPGYGSSVTLAWRGPAMRIVTPIRVVGDVVGWLDMTVEGESLTTLAVRAGGVTAVLLAIATTAAALLTRRLQPLMLQPLNQLLGAIEDVTRSADYSLRVHGSPDPEIDRFLAAFNMMIARVEQREADLARTLSELQAARDAAEAASVAKSRFVAGMSHELRTPLNAIIAYAELVLEDLEAEGGSPHVEDLRVIVGSARHLLLLINDVLDFARIEAQQATLDVHAFDPNQLLCEVVATLRPLVERNRNLLDLRIAAPLPTVVLDSTKLRQCLLNLGANAAKFTEDGQVTLTAWHEAEADRLVIAVADTGIGIEPGMIDRLFLPFTQADASTTRKYGGTGLGLAITDECVRMMEGTIQVVSTPGAGSCFTLWLPRRLPAASQHPRSQSRKSIE